MSGYMCYSLTKAGNITNICSASYAGTKHLRTKKDRGTNSMSRPTSKTDLTLVPENLWFYIIPPYGG